VETDITARNILKYKEKFQTLTHAKVAAYGTFAALFMRLGFRRGVLLTEHVIASSVFYNSSKQFK
jgi:hypothetical protein